MYISIPDIPYGLQYVKNIEHKVCQEYLKHNFLHIDI